MLLLCPLLLLCGLASGGPVQGLDAIQPRQPDVALEQRLWETLVLPAGFSLDLRSGVVVSRPVGDSATLAYTGGRLNSATPLRLLPSGSTAGGTHFSRDAGEAIAGVTPQPGQELIFECFGGVWGLLRILERSPQSVTLEFVLERDTAKRELQRLPPQLQAHSGPEGTHLQWPAKPGQLQRVERRRIAGGVGQSDSEWELLGRVSGGEFIDEEVNLARVSEYRVALIAQGGHFGSIARGVPGIEPPALRAQLGPGSELNLFSSVDDGLRVDLTIESIRPNGVQVYPGEGVLARPLTAEESKRWRIDKLTGEGFRRQHHFIAPGSVLALRLPEGIHCLFRVEDIRDQSVLFTRQLDLQGDRLFAPTPQLPVAQWEPQRGVVFRFDVPQREAPGAGARLVVERELTLDSGDWERCVTGQSGQLELVHECDESELLLRYRFRQGTDLERLSLASEPITVLVGGDNDGTRAVLLKRAILDLGAPDFARRERARAVLVALGEGAWPFLREALRSDNPELAASARELLVQGLHEVGAEQALTRGGFARLLLSIGAEELGLGQPPHPDWISRTPGVRAAAGLRGLGWRSSTPGELAGWRQVLAEEDPDAGVRLVARLALGLAAQDLGPNLGFDFGERDSRAASSESWPYGELQEVPEHPLEPWTALVENQARQALEIARAGDHEQQQRAEQDLVLALLLNDRHLSREDDLFLDSALRLIEDPEARLRGALELAHDRRAARQAPDAIPMRSIRLESPETELLVEELQRLKGGDLGALEIVLPAGIYEPLADGAALALDGAQLHLVAEGQVELDLGFTFLKGCHVTFSGLTVVPGRGIAINVIHSELLLRGCRVEGGTLGLLGSDAIVELEDSTILGAAGIRFGGRSLLLARGSRIECPGTAIAGARAMLLDRCVVISSQRNAIEGGSNSDLWALACLIQAAKAPYTRLTRGVLEAVALVGDLQASLGVSWGVRACSEHLRCDAEQSDFESKTWLEHCTLGR